MNSYTEIYILDLIGTFAFAAYGTHVAIKKEFDIFGIFVAAFLTALGGGTIREFILGNVPFYFYDNNYILAILLGYIFSTGSHKIFDKISRYVLLIDAVGLSTFAFIGAEKAARVGLGAFGIIFLATVTAVGGGLLRDVTIREEPQILRSDFYASPAIFLGIFYALFRRHMDRNILIYSFISITFVLRLLAIHFHFKLWHPWKKNDNEH